MNLSNQACSSMHYFNSSVSLFFSLFLTHSPLRTIILLKTKHMFVHNCSVHVHHDSLHLSMNNVHVFWWSSLFACLFVYLFCDFIAVRTNRDDDDVKDDEAAV